MKPKSSVPALDEWEEVAFVQAWALCNEVMDAD